MYEHTIPLKHMKKHNGILDKIKRRASNVKNDVYALYLAYKHPNTPWYAKLCCIIIVGYAFSPIDLIPDFIPVLGYLDDIILIPLGIMLAVKLVPKKVLAECRARAKKEKNITRKNWVAGSIIIAVWITVLFLCILWIIELFTKGA
ncbi:MAG: YkvA family protein [Spirochaetia bacterium]